MRYRDILLAVILLLLVGLSSSARHPGNYKLVWQGRVVATAYNSLEGQTDSTPWTTAAGTRCRPGVIASNFLPIGTKVMIKGFGGRIFTVEDRMHPRFNNRIDIWMKGHGEALQFGKRKITFYVLES